MSKVNIYGRDNEIFKTESRALCIIADNKRNDRVSATDIGPLYSGGVDEEKCSAVSGCASEGRAFL